MTIANSGDVYITDSERNRIYRVRHGSDAVQLFYQLDDTMPPNGIDISTDQRYLYVAVYGGHNVVRLNLEDRLLAQVSLPDGEQIFADGLYVYGKSLIAIQPWSNDRIIAQYHLDSSGTSVNDVSVLDNDSPHFLQPTTAVIVGESLYCIANSQLQLFRKMHSGEETVSELRHPLVLRVRLGNEVESH
jgi:DNA-binding beta-propeller fold protein YncE